MEHTGPKQGSAIQALGARLRLRGKSDGMRYNPFGLFTKAVKGIETLPDDETKLYDDCVYTHVASGASLRMLERREAAGTTASDIRIAHADSIDNTGSFHWPAEEVLAHLLLSSPPVFDVQSQSCTVLEIGAGAGLAGLLLAASTPARVILTDGNRGVVATAVENIRRLGLPAEKAQASQLLWQRPNELLAQIPTLLDDVDVVVGSDCLFFDAYHADLRDLLLMFLRHRRTGARKPAEVIIVAPMRGSTFTKFVQLLESEPDVAITTRRDFDAGMLAVHERLLQSGDAAYIPDRHYPLLLQLKTIDRREQR
jgi:predicted nicotinamide N-methyase